MKQWVLVGLLVSFTHLLPAQGIRGRITDSKAQVVPFAAIYHPLLQKGTTANLSGDYEFVLPNGRHEVIFQYLGYKSVRKSFELSDQWINLDIILETQHYTLAEVIITASGEDPAYFVMRKAIAMSQYYRNQVSEYTARVYLKGSGVPEKIPLVMRRQLNREGIKEGQTMVTETLSEITYRRNQPLQTRVISSRSAGMGTESSPMQFVTVSLYNDINGIISPVSRDAFQVYRYKLDGTFMENGRAIHKISVIPRRKGQDLYSGTIFIREGSWNIHSVDLSVEQKMFSVRLRQVFQEVKPLVWMPVSHDYDVRVEALGGRAKFRYMASVNDYKVVLNPAVDHAFYATILAAEERELDALKELVQQSASTTKTVIPAVVPAQRQRMEQLMEKPDLNTRETRELNTLIRKEASLAQRAQPLELKTRSTEVSDSAALKTEDFWNKNRPVLLTDEEKESFERIQSDTAKAGHRKPNEAKLVSKLFFGSNRLVSSDSFRLENNGLLALNAWSYNTVDGLLWTQKLKARNELTSARRFDHLLQYKYAFSRKSHNFSAGTYWLYGPLTRSGAGLELGRISTDFNAESGILALFNTMTTLFTRQNLMKLFEKDFVRLYQKTDITNGLVFSASLEYAHRRKLENNTDFYLTNWFGKEFTANTPAAFAFNNALFDDRKALLADFEIRYTPRHFYRIVKGRKQMAFSRYPTFSMKYSAGIPDLLGSNVNFSAMELGIKHGFSRRLLGRFDYQLRAGTYFKNDSLHFADYKHFAADPLYVGDNNNFMTFRGLTYYENSTNQSYLELHFRHEHSRILIKRLPFLANSLIRETVFGKTLYTTSNQPYYEFGYGVNQLFLLLNAEVFSSFRGAKHHQSGFRITIPIREGTVML